MGKLLPPYKKALIDEMTDNILSNTSYYYAFAANPKSYTGPLPNNTVDDYSAYFENDWTLIFGKRLFPKNFAPLIQNNIWANNTVYKRYDNTDQELYSNNQFYVISEPDYIGGTYNIFKCIDNANGNPSTIKPNIVQTTSFQTSDGYKWRYLTSISYRQYKTFSTPEFCPVYGNNITAIYANNYAGVETIVISNGGIGYTTYHEGVVKFANSSVIQIENSSSQENGLYNNSAIYIYNTTDTTGQIFTVNNYVSNSVGHWIYIDGEANTDNILPEATLYKISPRVVFKSDGNTDPIAYSVVNSTTNSISQINILSIGSDITWANVSIASSQGAGANLYPIVPPPGGHGAEIVSELNVKAFGVTFNFSNTEISTIPTNLSYNKIGLIKNPHILISNTMIGAANNISKGNTFTSNTFNQILEANLLTPVSFSVGDKVTSNVTSSVGLVAFANTSKIYLVGDKTFANGELITSSNGAVSSEIEILTVGDIYQKDIKPLYVQNINNINRSNTQTESFKLIIQI